MLAAIANLATQRSRLVVGIWIVFVVVLGALGRNLDHDLTVHPMYIDGTGSKRAHEIELRQFGSEYAMIVMLRGPEAPVESQGRRLARRLGALPRTLVVSPWASGANVRGLRPRPGVAALIVRVESSETEGVSGILPPVQHEVDVGVRGPVHASIAGFPVVVDSLRRGGEQAAALGELIAIPVLLLVLLLVFRSVLAALMPIVIGGAVVVATRGLLSLLTGVFELDLFAVGIVGMMGLALGVDYSLLVVSRFREAREQADVPEAVRATVSATARSVLPAGSGLMLAMLVAYFLLPGAVSHSVAISVMAATALSMVSAICVVPALLTLLGENLDRWSLPQRRVESIAALRWLRRLSRNPRAVAAIMVALLFCAAWAFTLNSAAASIGLLPSGDPGRRQQEDVQKALGPGWVAPMEVIVNGSGTPVTSRERLRALAAFQRHVEADPGVETMAGFAAIARGADGLNGIEGELGSQERGMDRLRTGISRLGKGAELNTSGLLQAASGSGQLDSGLGAARAGSGALSQGLRLTSEGSSRLAQGLGRADEGSGRLSKGSRKASSGAGHLTDALRKAQKQTGEIQGSARLFRNAMRTGEDRLGEARGSIQASEDQLTAARKALQRMSAGRADTEYAAVLAAVEEAERQLTGREPESGEPAPTAGAVTGLERAEGQFGVGAYLARRLSKNGEQASKGMRKLARGSARLERGLRRLASGSARISSGIGKLARGGQELSPALAKLSDGAEQLTGGLGQLETGAGQLANGLGAGAGKSKLLSGGLHSVGHGLERRQRGSSQIEQIRQRSPGLFRSAYFVLAGLDGSRPRQRHQLGFLINLDRGGQDARMLIVPRDDPTTVSAEETKQRIEADADALGRRTGTEVVVGGIAPSEIDVNNALRDEAPLLRLALSLVSLIVLIPVLRSLTIPLIAALINLITVSASFGILSLLFNGSLLGGPGYVDSTAIPAMMMVMFGLAIDYEVFVFARIREEYLRTGSNPVAVEKGIERTAHVVTGAATIMIAVFLAFSISEFVSIRNFGVAQAVAVAIDAFVVRLIVVPATMRRLGEWCWWMPHWLDRLLPGKPNP